MEWQAIPGYPAYVISDTGIVKKGEFIVKPGTSPSGLHQVKLRNAEGYVRQHSVGHIVHEIFIGDTHGKQVGYKDGDRSNITPGNLYLKDQNKGGKGSITMTIPSRKIHTGDLWIDLWQEIAPTIAKHLMRRS